MEHEHTSEPTVPANKPAKKPVKKRAKKRAVAARPPAAAKPSAMFEGITPSDCPTACRADCCAISGRAICAHPHKGGLQAGMQNPDSMRRYNEAKRALGKRKLQISGDA